MKEKKKFSAIDEYLGFEIETRLVLKHLRQDMFDEWFYDCLKYEDLFETQQHVEQLINSEVEAGLGQYIAEKRVVRDIPKKGLPVRYSLETDFYDRFVYQAICSFLMPFFDPLLGHRILSHRYAGKNGRYLFQSRIENWMTFEGITLTFRKEGQFILITDLANYFENIQIEDITEKLEGLLPSVKCSSAEKRQIRVAISILRNSMLKWSFAERFGLPQNRDASNFFANLVVADVDNKMVELGYDYYRYVDDIRIICTSESDARKALVSLIGELRNVGLNVNSAKTEILAPNCDEQALVNNFPTHDPRVNAIEQMWRSRSQVVILKSIKYLVALLFECIETGNTQSRQFRFAANRIAQLADVQILGSDELGTKEIQASILKNLKEQPASTDQYCKILKALRLNDDSKSGIEDFLLDRSTSIHDWQNYHLWLLLANVKYRSEKLDQLASTLIKYHLESPETAAVLIWAREVEFDGALNCVIKQFKKGLPFQTQRYFAIATRDVAHSELKKIYKDISPRVAGTRDRIRGYLDETGGLIFPKSKSKLEELFDQVTEYD